MEVNAKYRKVGQVVTTEVTIKLPDHCAPYFEKYTVELLEELFPKRMGIFFQTKDNPEVDIVSRTVYMHHAKGAMSEGFRLAFKDLDVIIQEERQTRLTI